MKADEGPLSRWARRKAETREKQSVGKERGGAAPSFEEEPAELPAQAEPAGGEAGPDEAAPPDLPDIETLDADSDFTVFMRDGVPEELRKLALRKLWRSDPILANLDGLNDYDEDYTVSESLVKGLKSAWEATKESPGEDAASEPESGQEDVAEAPAADRPVASEDGQDVEDGDEEALPDPDEKEPDPTSKTG